MKDFDLTIMLLFEFLWLKSFKNFRIIKLFIKLSMKWIENKNKNKVNNNRRLNVKKYELFIYRIFKNKSRINPKDSYWINKSFWKKTLNIIVYYNRYNKSFEKSL